LQKNSNATFSSSKFNFNHQTYLYNFEAFLNFIFFKYVFCILKVTEDFGTDPDLYPDPFVSGIDPRIRICNRIRYIPKCHGSGPLISTNKTVRLQHVRRTLFLDYLKSAHIYHLCKHTRGLQESKFYADFLVTMSGPRLSPVSVLCLAWLPSQ
jgi:hypothetical protein